MRHYGNPSTTTHVIRRVMPEFIVIKYTHTQHQLWMEPVIILRSTLEYLTCYVLKKTTSTTYTIPNQEIRLGIVHTYRVVVEELRPKFLWFFCTLFSHSLRLSFSKILTGASIHKKYIEYFVNIFKTLFYSWLECYYTPSYHVEIARNMYS